MTHLLKIILFLSIIPVCNTWAQVDSISYLNTKSEVVLLKNKDKIIPIQNLHNYKINSISSNKDILKAFEKRIDNYQVSSHFSNQDKLNITIDDSIIFLIQIDATTANLIKTFDKKIISTSKIILIADKKIISSYPDIIQQCDAVFYISKSDSANIDKAVQTIFGGQKADEKLSTTISNDFQKGFGLQTESQTRLGYTSPSEISIDINKLNNGIAAIINEALDSAAFPGCQILIAKNGTIFYHKSFGYHTYDKARSVINTDIYDLASVTKTTAATLALMNLYDNNQIDLDAKFSVYWPDFEKSDKEDISLRAVLAHHARLKPWIPFYSVSKKKNGKYKRKTVSSDSSKQFTYRLSSSYFLHEDFRTKKIYPLIEKSPLNEGSGYRYSGLSFYLFPSIIKDISGKSFEDFLNDTFYYPLSANTLGFVPTNSYSLDRIVPTEQDDYFRMELLHGVVHDEGAAMMKGISGNAGLFSNANDLAKVWQMLLNGGSYGGQQFISKATIDEFTKCQFCEEENKRGLGFDKPLIEYDSIKSSVAKDASPKSFGHTGYTGTMVWADPSNGLLFIFLSNRVHPTRDNRKIYTLNIRPRIHNLVYSLLDN